MIIISREKLKDLKFGDQSYMNPDELDETKIQNSQKFILYHVENAQLFLKHRDILRQFSSRVILLADYSHLTLEEVRQFNAFMVIDKSEGIKALNQFIVVCSSYISQNIEKALQHCQDKIKDLESQLANMSKMIQELSATNVEFLVKGWANEEV